MKRFPILMAGLAGLCLALSACVPIDGNDDGEGTSKSAEPSGGELTTSTEASPTDLELHPYSADGLDDRISTMPTAMAAYQVQQGKNPFDDGQPGSARVLLAEQFTSSTRFELPPEKSSDRITIELTCSNPVTYAFSLFDVTGVEIAGGAGTCDPDSPSAMSTGLRDIHREAPSLGQLKVTFTGESEMALALLTYIDAAAD